MQKKIIFIGKMGSGKTTFANLLEKEYDFLKFSLADKLKEIARDLFDMTEKDRDLLQQIGCKMREIRPEVWYRYLYEKIYEMQCCNPDLHAVIDDVRFINEYKFLTEKGFFPIKLITCEEKRRARLEETYGIVTEKQLNDVSEIEIDQIDCPNTILEDVSMSVDDEWEIIKKLVGAEIDG